MKSHSNSKKLKGQLMIELLWVFIFLSGFISAFSYLYQKSENHIEKYRMGKMIKNDRQKFQSY